MNSIETVEIDSWWEKAHNRISFGEVLDPCGHSTMLHRRQVVYMCASVFSVAFSKTTGDVTTGQLTKIASGFVRHVIDPSCKTD